MAKPQSFLDLDEDKRAKEYDRRRKALHEKFNSLPTDYSAMKMEHPEAPEQDAEAIRRNRNLSKVALIAQSIDALSNVVGVAKNPDWQPSSSPVGQMGVQAYDNLRNLDLDYHNRLKEHGRNVFNIDRSNQALDVQQQQADLSTQRSQIENELQDLRREYDQGNLNARNYADNLRRMQERAMQNGLNWDPATNTFSELPGFQQDQQPEPETPEESLYQQYGIDNRKLLLYDAYKRAEQQATPDMFDTEGNPLDGNRAAMRLAALEKELGTELYLIESIREQLNRGSQAQSPPQTIQGMAQGRQTDLVTRTEYRPFDSDAERIQAQARVPVITRKILSNQATESELQQWANDMRRMMLTENPNLTEEQLNEEISKVFDQITGSGAQNTSQPVNKAGMN